MTDIQFALGSSTQGVPFTDKAAFVFQAALSGGTGTAAYFQNQYAATQFIKWLNTEGRKAWTELEDTQGHPVFESTYPPSAHTLHSLRVRLSTLPNQEVISGKQQAAQFTWDGKHYAIVGSLTGTLTYGEQPLWMIDVPLGLSELVPMGVLANMAWAGLVKPLLLGFWNGVQSCFSSGLEVGSIEAAGEAASAAAEEAAVDGVIVEDAVVSMSVGAVALAGFVVLAAIPLILALLAHPSYHTLKVYNLTPYDITWHDPYFDEGVMNMAPIQGIAAGFNYTIPAQSLYSPAPDITPVMVSHEADFSFASGSEYHGLGYALSFTLTDPQNNHATVATAALVYDIPWAGDNSLYATFAPFDSLASLYSQVAGRYCQTQMRALAKVDKSMITLTATYDYLSGKHPNPDNQEMYIYNSVVAFMPWQS